MAVAFLTFVLSLTVVVASYWGLVLRPEGLARAQLRGRLHIGPVGPAAGSSLVKRGGRGLAGVSALAWHRRLLVAPVARLIDSAGRQLNPSRLMAWTLLATALVIVLARVLGTGWMTAVGIGLLAPVVPFAYLRRAAEQRLFAFEEGFPEAIDLMARALRTGHALTATLAMISEEMPDPVGSEFRLIYEQQNYGLPLPQVLKSFAARTPIVDARLFVTAVLTQRETGGNLAEILDNLASVTRDRFRVRRQIRVLTAQGRMTGWVLACFPLVLALALYLVNPDHMKAFLHDPTGVHMLQVAVFLQVVGTVAIRRIVAVEY
jgi:tight adherence protein B